MFIEPVARFRSPFKTKFGIPRQAGLVPGLKGRIVFEPEFRSADAVRGLEGFEYIWLIWGFSGNKPRSAAESASEPASSVAEPTEATLPMSGALRRLVSSAEPQVLRPGKATFQATVRPPRLGGNERVGVFASRSPFRPNGLGLSSVRIESIEYDAKDPDGKPLGPVINVLGADLMDGTPVYDIKPYVTYADSHPDAASGFVDAKEWTPLKVVFAPSVTSTVGELCRTTGSVTEDDSGPHNGSVTEPAEVTIPGWTEADVTALKEVLAQDPRPSYQNDPDKIYGMIFNDMDVRFKVDGDMLTVVVIKPAKDKD